MIKINKILFVKKRKKIVYVFYVIVIQKKVFFIHVGIDVLVIDVHLYILK